MFWVVCYDIPDDRRRRRVMKTLEGFGRRVQFSVFECELNDAKLMRLEHTLQRLIHEREDNVRLYPMNEGDLTKVRMFGMAKLERTGPYKIVEDRGDYPF
jgi:CRISPR-associated protein Cas2